MNLFRTSVAAAAIAALSSGASALTFNYTFTAGTSAQAQQAFIDAGARWSSLFSDNVTIDLTVGTASLGAGILAQAGSRFVDFGYATAYAGFVADRSSADDFQAVGSLSAGPAFSMLINRTADNPNGAGSATPYVDNAGANNSILSLTAANAKALGLNAGTGSVAGLCIGNCDAGIQFSNSFAFDFNPNDGITAGEFDFVGIATHEIGHALGFISGVDVLDFNSPPFNGPFFADQFTFVSSLDLFRYSAQSAAAGVIDWTADTRSKYFSLDGGVTVGPGFSTGSIFGDGQQASHWKDSLGIGIMDPTAGRGELLAISANDVRGFDVIGWNVNVAAIPEPSTYALFGLGLAAIGVLRRRRAD